MKIKRKAYSVIGIYQKYNDGYISNIVVNYDSYISALNVVELLNKLDEDDIKYEVQVNNYES